MTSYTTCEGCGGIVYAKNAKNELKICRITKKQTCRACRIDGIHKDAFLDVNKEMEVSQYYEEKRHLVV